MRKKLILISCILFLISCKEGTTSIKKDDGISTEIRTQISNLDKVIIESIKSKDFISLKKICSEKLLNKNENELKNLVSNASSLFSKGQDSILNQYYSLNSTKGLNNTIISDVQSDNGYILRFNALNKEVFVSLLTMKIKKNSYLLTNIYGKDSNEWKLNVFELGQYKIDNKNAHDYYKIATIKHKKELLFAAYKNIHISSTIVKPASQIFQYKEFAEMEALYKTIITDLKEKYQFPIEIFIDENPVDFLNVSITQTEEGYYPMIQYLTKINLDDEKALELENKKIQNIISDYFEGIEIDNKYIIYQAYNNKPNRKTSTPNYGFIQKLE